jgi:phosphatidylethanolamine-binding protein (PEBP) family uncharacterized protein
VRSGYALIHGPHGGGSLLDISPAPEYYPIDQFKEDLMSFRLWSSELKEGGRMPEAQVFNGMGHSGGNRSPHLAWEGAPEGTKSFVVTAYDPDAPTGSGWWHWVVANIPATAKELPADSGSGKGLPPERYKLARISERRATAEPRRHPARLIVTFSRCMR